MAHSLKSLGLMILVGPFQLRIFWDLKISSNLQGPISEIISDGGFMCRNVGFVPGVRNGSSGVWFRFFPRLCLAAFCHPGCEWNTQILFPARELTCHCSDQWFRELGFLFSISVGKPEAVNRLCALQSPKVQQAEKIPCACSYIRMLNTRVINLSSPQQLLGHALMCFCVRFNCSGL